MGVDFYSCNYCDETFCDVGYYVRCACGNHWCSDACASKDGFKQGCLDGNGCNCECDGCDCTANCNCCQICDYEGTCKYCRKEDATDSQLFYYLLKRFKLDRAQLTEEYFKDKSLGADNVRNGE